MTKKKVPYIPIDQSRGFMALAIKTLSGYS